MKKAKKISYCTKCEKWRGTDKECSACKKATLQVDAPRRRGGYYYIPGVRTPLPHVTSILQTIAKPALITWAARIAAESALENPWQSVQEATSSIYRTKGGAAERGKDVHKIIERLIKGEKVKNTQVTKGYVEAYEKFKKDMPHRVIASEKLVYSIKYKYAGTLDYILKLKSGDLVIADFKTGKYIYDEAGLQLAAYKAALQEMYPDKKNPDRTVVIHLKPDATYTVIEKLAPLTVFLALKRVWEWQEGLNGK